MWSNPKFVEFAEYIRDKRLLGFLLVIAVLASAVGSFKADGIWQVISIVVIVPSAFLLGRVIANAEKAGGPDEELF